MYIYFNLLIELTFLMPNLSINYFSDTLFGIFLAFKLFLILLFNSLIIYIKIILNIFLDIFIYSIIGAIIGWISTQSTKFIIRFKVWHYCRNGFNLIYLFCNLIEFWIELFEEKFIYIFILLYIYCIRSFIFFIFFIYNIIYTFIQKIYLNNLVMILHPCYEIIYNKIPILLNFINFFFFYLCIILLILLLYNNFFRQYLSKNKSYFFYLLLWLRILFRWIFFIKIDGFIDFILKIICCYIWVLNYHLFIIYFVKIIFFSSFFPLQLFFILLFSWFLLLWLFRHLVITLDTSWMWRGFRQNRKRLIYPLKLILIFYSRLYYKGIMFIVLCINYFNIYKFFEFFFLYRLNVFNFLLLYKFPLYIYIFGFFISCFHGIGYWKKVGFYIFNYRRIEYYIHWLAETIFEPNKKEFLFKWFNIVLGYIQFWRYSKMERKRWFMQCYCFDIEDFLAIGLIYYFKRQLIKITRSVYYYYVLGNWILKEVDKIVYFNIKLFFLKYSFYHTRYMRLMLLIYVRNYSFLRSFLVFSFKLHFYSSLFNFKFTKKRGLLNDCKINHYF